MNKKMRRAIRSLITELRSLCLSDSDDIAEQWNELMEELCSILEENAEGIENYPDNLQNSATVEEQRELQDEFMGYYEELCDACDGDEVDTESCEDLLDIFEDALGI